MKTSLVRENPQGQRVFLRPSSVDNPILIVGKDISHQINGNSILKNCSFDIKKQELIVLIGENGTGKTTLFHLISQSKPLQLGRIERFTTNPFWLGFVPDKPPLYPFLKVYNFLEICAEMRQIYDKNAISHVLSLCQLEAVAQQKCGNLSHGFRQRVSLAQALIHQPELLLLDEVSNGLDYQKKNELIQLLKIIKQQSAVFMVSHDLHESVAIADRIFLMKNQRIIEILLPHNRHEFQWLEFSDISHAQQWINKNEIKNILPFGRFVGVQNLKNISNIKGLHQSFPANALQEKLEDAAKFSA